MTNLNPKWVAYNNLHNEGAEGFNPHPLYLDSSENEPLSSILSECAYQLRCRLNAISTSDPKWKEGTEELEALELQVAAALRAEFEKSDQYWDRDTTLKKREAWNAEVKSRMAAGVKHINLPALQEKMGFAFVQLQNNVAHHGLKDKQA